MAAPTPRAGFIGLSLGLWLPALWVPAWGQPRSEEEPSSALVPARLRTLEPASLAMVYDRGVSLDDLGDFSSARSPATTLKPEAAQWLPRRSGAGSDRAGSRNIGDTPPWIDAAQWDVPSEYGYDVFEGTRTRLFPWALLEESLDKSRVLVEPPAYAGVELQPLFTVRTPRETEFARKLRKLVRLKFFRELRHVCKRELRSQYLADPSLTFAEYEERLFLINSLGKETNEIDAYNAEYTARAFQQGFFGKKRVDGERDIELISWGPLTVTDTGSLRFKLGTIAHALDGEEDEPLTVGTKIEVGDRKKKPLLATKDYEIDTAFNLDVDPFAGASRGDAMYALRRYGVSVEVDWLSDVLGREMVSTELEVESDSQGEFRGFFNIVVKSR